MPGGSDCNPVRFETVVEPANNNHIIHATVDNDEMIDDDDGLVDDYDKLLDMVCSTAETESAGDVFKDSPDFAML